MESSRLVNEKSTENGKETDNKRNAMDPANRSERSESFPTLGGARVRRLRHTAH